MDNKLCFDNFIEESFPGMYYCMNFNSVLFHPMHSENLGVHELRPGSKFDHLECNI